MPVPVATLPAPPVTAPATAAPVTEAAPAAPVPAPPLAAPPAPEPARAPARSAGATPAEARKPGADVPGPASGARTHTQVQLTAEPRALVLVDGVAAGRTPLSLSSLTPGQHSFVFKSELLGEKLETQLNLRDGGRQRVHADFTSATPQVYLR
jgi:hypothetical protein